MEKENSNYLSGLSFICLMLTFSIVMILDRLIFYFYFFVDVVELVSNAREIHFTKMFPLQQIVETKLQIIISSFLEK